jgi:hypothetical protein
MIGWDIVEARTPDESASLRQFDFNLRRFSLREQSHPRAKLSRRKQKQRDERK